MNEPSSPPPPRVAVVGGGLAGLAAAAALSQRGCRVELFEARRQLGGRAGSFVDPESGQPVDHCQHVSLGCCTNLAHFAETTGIEHLFRRDRNLHFFGPSGSRHDLAGSGWLPAPLHLAGSLLSLRYLSWSDRIGIGRALWRLAREPHSSLALHDWLARHGQSDQAIDGFWSVILTSALGDTVDRVSVTAARKVFVTGFMSNRRGYEMIVPRVPLGELYGRIAQWLAGQGVAVHLETPVHRIAGDGRRASGIMLRDQSIREFDFVIVTVPWRRATELIADWPRLQPVIDSISQIAAAPITAAHLWFDRPITRLPHAVLVGRTSQWVFAKSQGVEESQPPDNYYQVVISGSHALAGRDRSTVIDEVCGDLRAVFPEARRAQLLRWRLVTDPQAVFSVRPGLDDIRPAQQTPVPNLMLAGDWTATAWPATMEGAVRSGYLAAECVLRELGRPAPLVAPELPAGWIGRRFFRSV